MSERSRTRVLAGALEHAADAVRALGEIVVGGATSLPLTVLGVVLVPVTVVLGIVAGAVAGTRWVLARLGLRSRGRHAG